MIMHLVLLRTCLASFGRRDDRLFHCEDRCFVSGSYPHKFRHRKCPTTAEIQHESQKEVLDMFREGDFQDAFQTWQERWECSISVQGNYFKGVLVIKKLEWGGNPGRGNTLRVTGFPAGTLGMERRWIVRAEETGVPRENPPESGIIQHDSHMRKSGSEPTGDQARIAMVGGERPSHCVSQAPCWLEIVLMLSIILVTPRTQIKRPARTLLQHALHRVNWEGLSRTRGSRWLGPGTVEKGASTCIDRPRGSTRREYNINAPREQRLLLVRLFVSHLSESGSIPGGAAPGFSCVGIVPDDAAGRRVSSVISDFPTPLHSNAAPDSPHFTLVDSRDLEFKSGPNLSILHIPHSYNYLVALQRYTSSQTNHSKNTCFASACVTAALAIPCNQLGRDHFVIFSVETRIENSRRSGDCTPRGEQAGGNHFRSVENCSSECSESILVTAENR
ncbi:hypothetical protein PR048_015776 [Dryococelus australis]|uniref:Uncharacterized protein n=1 Tax=Dryococelus australis TaxID=614101 RepID=A0ABQ9HHW1_9NEOP|nr:hypothetical protein PR048_015776 [Dryococelus australis]